MRSTRLLLAPLALTLGGCGTDVAGPSATFYSCLFASPTSLEVGEAVGFQGSGSRSTCLTAGDGGASFVYVPFLGVPPAADDDPGSPLAVTILGGGVVPAAPLADPAPDALHALDPRQEPRLDHRLHARLREREAAELGPLIRPGPPGSPAPVAHAPATAPLAVGEVMELSIALSCSRADRRRGLVMAVSDWAVVVAQEETAGRLSAAQYAQIAQAFDTLVHPMATRYFGEPTDIDGNGRVIIYFTSMVNRMNEPGAGYVTAGLFWAGDLFPATPTSRLQGCPAGNQAEMFYLAVPDPTGAMGPPIQASWLMERVVQILGHEYQHLLNAARRMYINEATVFEQVWLNEGLSHIAEELLFFEATGLPRGTNLARSDIQSSPDIAVAYERFMGGNHVNLRRFLMRPDTTSLMGRDGLATRGATWSFLRYAADRRGAGDEEVFYGLANSTHAGLDNLNQVLGGSALDWMSDWAVALVADDLVAGLAPRHTFPSWNLRDLHGDAPGGYVLRPHPLEAGRTSGLDLIPGGSGYLLFGVDAGGRAAVHVEAGGGAPPRALRGTVLRVR